MRLLALVAHTGEKARQPTTQMRFSVMLQVIQAITCESTQWTDIRDLILFQLSYRLVPHLHLLLDQWSDALVTMLFDLAAPLGLGHCSRRGGGATYHLHYERND